MKRRSLLCLGGAVALNLAWPATTRAERESCAVPPELIEVSVKLPHFAERLRARQKLNIVAIGGASTRGAAAGAPELAYPHPLELALPAFSPHLPITALPKAPPRPSPP